MTELMVRHWSESGATVDREGLDFVDFELARLDEISCVIVAVLVGVESLQIRDVLRSLDVGRDKAVSVPAQPVRGDQGACLSRHPNRLRCVRVREGFVSSSPLFRDFFDVNKADRRLEPEALCRQYLERLFHFSFEFAQLVLGDLEMP